MSQGKISDLVYQIDDLDRRLSDVGTIATWYSFPEEGSCTTHLNGKCNI